MRNEKIIYFLTLSKGWSIRLERSDGVNIDWIYFLALTSMTRVWIFPGGYVFEQSLSFRGWMTRGGVIEVKSLVANTWQVPRGTPKWLLVNHLDLFANWSQTRADDRGQRPSSVARNLHYLFLVESTRISYQQWPSSRADSAPSAD